MKVFRENYVCMLVQMFLGHVTLPQFSWYVAKLAYLILMLYHTRLVTVAGFNASFSFQHFLHNAIVRAVY